MRQVTAIQARGQARVDGNPIQLMAGGVERPLRDPMRQARKRLPFGAMTLPDGEESLITKMTGPNRAVDPGPLVVQTDAAGIDDVERLARIMDLAPDLIGTRTWAEPPVPRRPRHCTIPRDRSMWSKPLRYAPIAPGGPRC